MKALEGWSECAFKLPNPGDPGDGFYTMAGTEKRIPGRVRKRPSHRRCRARPTGGIDTSPGTFSRQHPGNREALVSGDTEVTDAGLVHLEGSIRLLELRLIRSSDTPSSRPTCESVFPHKRSHGEPESLAPTPSRSSI